MARTAKLTSILLVCSALAARAADLPKGFTVPADFREDIARRKSWDFDTAQFDFLPANAKDMTHQKVEGHLWRTALSILNKSPVDPKVVVPLFASDLEKDGWTILRREGTLVARKTVGTGELWVRGQGPGTDFRLEIVETAPPSRPLTLPPPQKEIETIGDAQDFPYALPFPGGALQKTTYDRRPFLILLDAKQTSYAAPFATKWYAEPRDVSSYEFVAVYRKALEGAGWFINQFAVAGDATVLAHYTKNGRDLWLYTRGDGSQQMISVADFGADAQAWKLKQQLGIEGHVALYGIYFDTDSSTARPESEATLQQVLQLLKGDPALRLEIQGHTDDSGAPAHNSTLSEARAASVQTWLIQHGIAASRLTSKGFGATNPVADNRSPEGRAKNRRVELARP